MLKQQEVNCYLGYLLSEATTLTEDQIAILVWEAIIEAADTTLVTTEWAMYELSRDPRQQVVTTFTAFTDNSTKSSSLIT